MSDRPTIAHRQGRYNTTVTSNHTILQTDEDKYNIITSQTYGGRLIVTPKNTIFLSSVTGLAEIYV